MVFDLNLRYDFFNPEAYRDPPPVACVREARILVSHSAVAADRDELVAPLLEVLARVWNRTTDDEDWATVQAAFDEQLAGCRSAREATPQAVQEGAIVDTMMSVFGVAAARGALADDDEWWLFEDCDAEPDRGVRAQLATAVEAALFGCPYDADAAEAAWLASGASAMGFYTAGWAGTAQDVCV